MTTSLKIFRKSEFVGKYRKYKIMVDGKNVGAIKTGEMVEVPIQPGNHEMYLKIDWGGSNTIIFNVLEEEQLQFKCSYRGVWSNSFQMFYYIFFKPFDYLLLEKIDDGENA